MAKSPYKTIGGKRYDRAMVEFCDDAVEGIGSGRISKADAEQLFEMIKEGGKYSDLQKSTMRYIRYAYNWTDAADDWLRTEVRRWAATRGHQTRSCMMKKDQLFA